MARRAKIAEEQSLFGRDPDTFMVVDFNSLADDAALLALHFAQWVLGQFHLSDFAPLRVIESGVGIRARVNALVPNTVRLLADRARDSQAARHCPSELSLCQIAPRVGACNTRGDRGE